ncbi:MAG: hypothetical protein BWY79_01116 [Actinobacteria bacterium ADurb.Bin444]|nr:MAG: hypothetical protein BWY79_01116 [Actinobacteria bacterium ADurb.Bin444]
MDAREAANAGGKSLGQNLVLLRRAERLILLQTREPRWTFGLRQQLAGQLIKVARVGIIAGTALLQQKVGQGKIALLSAACGHRNYIAGKHDVHDLIGELLLQPTPIDDTVARHPHHEQTFLVHEGFL